jgi:hypothetical protein
LWFLVFGLIGGRDLLFAYLPSASHFLLAQKVIKKGSQNLSLRGFLAG